MNGGGVETWALLGQPDWIDLSAIYDTPTGHRLTDWSCAYAPENPRMTDRYLTTKMLVDFLDETGYPLVHPNRLWDASLIDYGITVDGEPTRSDDPEGMPTLLIEIRSLDTGEPLAPINPLRAWGATPSPALIHFIVPEKGGEVRDYINRVTTDPPKWK